jgi:hypothetical protein
MSADFGTSLYLPLRPARANDPPAHQPSVRLLAGCGLQSSSATSFGVSGSSA